MDAKLVDRVKGFIGGERGGDDDQAAVEAVPRTKLFACRDCDATFISIEMDACPQCDSGAGLEVVPNERDLGFA